MSGISFVPSPKGTIIPEITDDDLDNWINEKFKKEELEAELSNKKKTNQIFTQVNPAVSKSPKDLVQVKLPVRLCQPIREDEDSDEIFSDEESFVPSPKGTIIPEITDDDLDNWINEKFKKEELEAESSNKTTKTNQILVELPVFMLADLPEPRKDMVQVKLPVKLHQPIREDEDDEILSDEDREKFEKEALEAESSNKKKTNQIFTQVKPAVYKDLPEMPTPKGAEIPEITLDVTSHSRSEASDTPSPRSPFTPSVVPDTPSPRSPFTPSVVPDTPSPQSESPL